MYRENNRFIKFTVLIFCQHFVSLKRISLLQSWTKYLQTFHDFTKFSFTTGEMELGYYPPESECTCQLTSC